MKKIILMLLLLTCVLCSCGQKQAEPKDPAGKKLTWDTKYENQAKITDDELYKHGFENDMVYLIINKYDVNGDTTDKSMQEKFINSFCDTYAADNYDYDVTTQLNSNNVEATYISVADSDDPGTYRLNVLIFGDGCVYGVCSTFLADDEKERKAKEEKFVYKLVATMDFE